MHHNAVDNVFSLIDLAQPVTPVTCSKGWTTSSSKKYSAPPPPTSPTSAPQ